MKVLKFGGTSVGTPSSLRNVVKIANILDQSAVIVVSALGGVTDLLIATARKAADGDASYLDDIAELKRRHMAMIEASVPEKNRTPIAEFAQEMLGQMSDICRGLSLVGELTERSLDMIVAFGERISSRIVAGAIPGAIHVDSLEVIRTERWFGKNIADTKLTSSLLKEHLSDIQEKHPVVMGGFISRDRDSSRITNLGRGGSDYTAALVAAALNAEELQIWTDVDGFMTADPRIIKSAQVLRELSFVESMELCSFGAKVIYPPTIYPVFKKGIPIRILNTFHISAPGTWITDHSATQQQEKVHGLAALRDCCLINIKGESIANMADSNSRIFNTLAKQGINVLLVSRTAPVATVSFAVKGSDSELAMKELQREFAPELTSGTVHGIAMTEEVETVAAVGENIGNNFAVRSKIFNTLETGGIEVLAAAYGTSPTTVSFVVPKGKADKAMKFLHKNIIEE